MGFVREAIAAVGLDFAAAGCLGRLVGWFVGRLP